MKKLVALAAALLLFVGASSAQTYFNLGYGQGTNLETDNGVKFDGQNSNIFYAGLSHNFRFGDFVGFELGANFAYDLMKKSLPANIYSSYSGDMDETVDFRYEYMGVNVPALFNYKFALSRDLCFKLFLGPTFNYGLKYTSTPYGENKDGWSARDYFDNDNPSYKRFTVSASAAFAMEVAEAFRVKIGYDYGITDRYLKENCTIKQNVLNFSVAYMF